MEWETIDDFGMCVRDLKYFTIPERVLEGSVWAAKEYVLHEIAHALDPDGLGDNHNKYFYNLYASLLIKHMEEGLSENAPNKTKKRDSK